jgi:hypothetical protein
VAGTLVGTSAGTLAGTLGGTLAGTLGGTQGGAGGGLNQNPPIAAGTPRLDISELQPGDIIEGRYKYLEKIGKGGRVLHQHRAFWSRLDPVDFIHPRRQVSGGSIPRCLVERIEALLRGAPLPRRRREWGQVHGRLVRAR